MTEAIALTNSLLKGTMTDALCDRGYCTDFDTCMTSGYYVCSSQRTVNFPTGSYPYGILTVRASGSFISQEFHSHRTTSSGVSESCTYIRMYHTATAWGPWSRVTSAPVAS